ncbi:MAG TPA: ABC transporter permease [Galbitalea sp.]|nr:ABC transporter permease [Galbitalea sp.]
MTAVVTPRRERTSAQRYRHSLWLLTKRDLQVRYTTSVLGYFWSILDPLLMSLIYYFVFVIIFKRGGPIEQPYIVFLMCALLPWTWFNGAINDMTKAFTRESKLIRSTSIPRSIWVIRTVLSKGIEFLASLPVLVVFVLIADLFTNDHAHLQFDIVYTPIALAIEATLITGIGLLLAPIVVFFRDLERAIKLALRLLFYTTPIVYGLDRFKSHNTIKQLLDFNPLTGIMGIYRSAFFVGELNWTAVLISAIISVSILVIGIFAFRRNVRLVLKEL